VRRRRQSLALPQLSDTYRHGLSSIEYLAKVLALPVALQQLQRWEAQLLLLRRRDHYRHEYSHLRQAWRRKGADLAT
jgi:hypothetical protein